MEGDNEPLSEVNKRLKLQVEQLEAVVADLSRRIQNSNYIIESEKKVQ